MAGLTNSSRAPLTPQVLKDQREFLRTELEKSRKIAGARLEHGIHRI